MKHSVGVMVADDVDLELYHLSDFFVKGHGGDLLGHLFLELRVGGDGGQCDRCVGCGTHGCGSGKEQWK